MTLSPEKLAPPLISLAEARVIIDGAIAYAREKNTRMGIVVLDTSGEIVAGREFYDYAAKYLDDTSRTEIPADLTPAVVSELRAGLDRGRAVRA